jgi:hypothetical protein
MKQAQQYLERVLCEAEQYGVGYFSPAAVSSVTLAGSVIGAQHGYDSWVVRVESREKVLLVTVWVGPQGDVTSTHYAGAVRKDVPKTAWPSAA